MSVVTGALKESRCGYLAANTVIDTLRQMFNTAATRPPTGGERQPTKRQAADEWPRDETRNRGFRSRSLRCRAPKLPRYMSNPVLRIRNVRRRQAVAGLGVAQLPPISQTIRRRRRLSASGLFDYGRSAQTIVVAADFATARLLAPGFTAIAAHRVKARVGVPVSSTLVPCRKRRTPRVAI